MRSPIIARKGRARGVAILFLMLPLGACASFDGIPKPVVPVEDVVRLATTGAYSAEAAVAIAQDATRDDEEKRRYRDAYIAIQLKAADARYLDFRTKLSRQMKGANFGLELGILGLTSAGAIASERTANILSAAASGLAGSKSALSKEVYFEKTLPALIASMDARRLTQKAGILERRRTRSVGEYPIEEAMIELGAYELAGSLDGAIEQVTSAASAERAQAQAAYDNVIATCFAEEGVDDVWADIASGLRKMQPGQEAELDKLSEIVGTPTEPAFDEQRELILTAIGQQYCSASSASDLLSRMKLSTGLTFP